MYIRFVVEHTDPDSHRRVGLFQVSQGLVEAHELTSRERAELEELYQWFNHRLPRPTRFARSRRCNACPSAISWFKPSAMECIGRMHELAAVFRRNGTPVSMIKTRRPGYVVYEDQYQVVAQPFSDTRT